MEGNFTPFPNLYFRLGTPRWYDWVPLFSMNVYMLNVQLHLSKYNYIFRNILTVIRVVNVNFDEYRTRC
jgi:hypothetical protein